MREPLQTLIAGNYRAVVEWEEGPTEPEDDGSFPVLRFDYGAVSELTVTSYRLPERVLQTARKLAEDNYVRDAVAQFTRYLRMFYGTTTVDTWQHPSDHRVIYVAFDTVGWREFVGLAADQRTTANFGDWQHYVNGDVFFVTVERRELGVTGEHYRRAADLFSPGVPFDTVAVKAQELAVEEESLYWRQVICYGGLYGDDWAEQSARNALAEFTDEPAVVQP